MSFVKLLEVVEQRIVGFQSTHDPELVLDGRMIAVATALWQAAQPADPDCPSPGERLRLIVARRAIGWLHFYRSGARPEDPDIRELARALAFLEPLADELEAVPGPLHCLMGATADPEAQERLATAIAGAPETATDPVLVHVWAGLLTECTQATPRLHPARVRRLTKLAIALQILFERVGENFALDQAIDVAEEAVAATSEADPDRAVCLNILGSAYRSRFERAGTVTDLNSGITAAEQALAATPEHGRDRAMYLNNLGSLLHCRFEFGGSRADLDDAIDVTERASAIEPDPMFLSNLGCHLWLRFLRDGSAADLDRAIALGEQAVAATSATDLYRARHLANLGNNYRMRFERGGSTADLDRAIELGALAVDATTPGNIALAAYLSNLGIAYRMRFERDGIAADLHRGIEFGERAVAEAPTGDPLAGRCLSNLGIAYRVRFQRSESADDLDRSIAVTEQAVASTAVGQIPRALYLSNLGITYLLRYRHGGSASDLDRAVEISRQAVDATPTDHPDWTGHLVNHGIAHITRFEDDAVEADLDRAIEIIEQAVEATPTDHPERAAYLTNLAALYQTRLDAGGEALTLESLHGLAAWVSEAMTSPPVARIRAGRVVGAIANAMNEHTLAVKLLDEAAALTQIVPPRQSGWEDQEFQVGRHSGLAAEAIAAHCAINDPAGAVEVAELARGVLLAAQLDSRTDLSELDAQFPELAEKLRLAREHINRPETGSATADSPAGMTDLVEIRKRWWAEHDATVTAIRHRPGFEGFLRPPRLTDLAPALRAGTVIMVNAAPSRSDAIILAPGADPLCVPLPELAAADVESHARELMQATYFDSSLAGTLRRQRVVPQVLAWLWDTTVYPVLQAITKTSGDAALPRIWWMPVGQLGLFPLHAAGYPGQPGALDAVVSSYIPTLRTLAHAQNRPRTVERRQLTVAMPHTPGLANLPGTVAEASALHARHPDIPLMIDSSATIDHVRTALSDATWAHFASHADVDFTVPSRSGLVLHDGVLSLPEISRLRLVSAEIAYLSACSTAHRGVRHVDEVLHPASAFQLAGFRHVIASLWPLADGVAAVAAACFYREHPSTPTAEQAAAVLHKTILDLRAQNPNRPDLWAALVHSGP